MKKIIRKLSLVVLIGGVLSCNIAPNTILQAKGISIEEVMEKEVSEQNIVKKFVATQDAYTYRANPDKKYGVEDVNRLMVKSPNDGNNPPSSTSRRSYIEFDLKGYQEKYVKKASIKLYLENKIGTTIKDNLSLYETTQFDENQLTWNTAPAETGKFITSHQVDKTKVEQYVEIDVTNYINEKLLNGEANQPIKVMLKIDKAYESDQGGMIFASKEQGEFKAPVLEVEEGMPAPVVRVEGIQDESVVEGEIVTCKISATSLGTAILPQVKVNDQVVQAVDGTDYELHLDPGENIITISATDIEGNTTTQRFMVKAIDIREPIVSFQVIADTHISNSNPQDARLVALKNSLQEMKQISPNSSGVFILGDCTQNGSEAQYQGLMSILGNPSHNPLAYYPAIGNHDVRWLEGGFLEAEERFLRHFDKEKVYYEEWLEGYQFIVLGTEKDLKDDAYISDEQMLWLEKRLEVGAELGQPIFVMMHQPLNVGFYDSDPWNVGERDQELKHLFAKYPQVVYLSGHLHNPFEREKGPLFNGKYCTMIDVPSFHESKQIFYMDVYEDKIVVKGRDMKRDKWNYKATFEIGLPADIPESDIIEPVWENNAQIKAQADSQGCIDLEWSGATDNIGVVAYQILRNGTLYATVDATVTSYKADKLFGGQTYNFKIEAKDAEGRVSKNGPSITIDTRRDSVNVGKPAHFEKEIIENILVYMDFDQNYIDQANNFAPRLRRGKIVYEETPFGYGAKYDKKDSLIIGDVDYGVEDFTVSYWIKAKGIDYNGGPVIVSNKRFSNRQNPGWIMAMTNGGKLWYNTAAKRNGSKVQIDDQGKSNIIIANEEWSYMTVSTDRTNNKVSIYKNGEKQTTHDISTLNGLSFNTQHPTLIGADGEGQNWGNFEFIIDEFVIVKKAISDEQAKDMYDIYVNPVESKETITLQGDMFVTSGNNLRVTLGIDSFKDIVYAQDLSMNYNSQLFELVGIKGLGKTIVADTEEKNGEIRVLLITEGGQESGNSTIELEFLAKKVGLPTKSFFEVVEAEAGIVIANEAKIIMPEGESLSITLYPDNIDLDKTKLLDTIREAEEMSAKAVVGVMPGEYPVEAKGILDKAIEVAKEVATTSEIQLEIDQATNVLREAIEAFKATQIKPELEDITGDGKVDVADLALIAYYYQQIENTPGWESARIADINKDGKIDIGDLTLIANKMLKK